MIRPFHFEKAHNKAGQADMPPQRSFVANATSLALLRHAAYRRRYVSKTHSKGES